jgi:hypothetical protein
VTLIVSRQVTPDMVFVDLWAKEVFQRPKENRIVLAQPSLPAE